MPPNTVYVGRPSKWGNPWFVEGGIVKFNSPCGETWMEGAGTIETVMALYKDSIVRMCLPLDQLAGKNLACWCKLSQPCHADILLALVNKTAPNPQAQWYEYE